MAELLTLEAAGWEDIVKNWSPMAKVSLRVLSDQEEEERYGTRWGL